MTDAIVAQLQAGPLGYRSHRTLAPVTRYLAVDGAGAAGDVLFGAAGAEGRLADDPTVVDAPELLAVWLLLQGAHINRRAKTTTAAMAHIQAELTPSRRSRFSRIMSLLN